MVQIYVTSGRARRGAAFAHFLFRSRPQTDAVRARACIRRGRINGIAAGQARRTSPKAVRTRPRS